MTDILDRLRSAISDQKQFSGVLLRDAVDEMQKLRQENQKQKKELDHFYRINGPED